MQKLLAFAALFALSACAEAEEEQVSARAVFDEEVLPLLQEGCAQPTCHGVPDGEDHGDLFGGHFLGLPVDGSGAVTGEARVDVAYASTKQFIDTYADDARDSSLVRKILVPSLGGVVHDGPASLDSLEGPAYLAFARWIALDEEGGEVGTCESE